MHSRSIQLGPWQPPSKIPKINASVLLPSRAASSRAIFDRSMEPTGEASTPFWKKALPWVGAVGIIGWIFGHVPFAEVIEAARGADLGTFFLALGLAVVGWFLLDSRAYAYVITRFNAPLSWAEARALRGVTYIVAAINWNIGTASVVLYLRRLKQIPVFESTSSVFFYTNFDGLVLVSLAFLGASLFGESPEVLQIQRGAGVAFGVIVVTLALLMSSKPSWGWLTRARAWPIFLAFRRARPRDFAVLLVIRLTYFAGFVVVFTVGARAFGIDLPWMLAVASVPVVLMAGALPIAPAGLGTQAATMLFFWSEHGSEAQIVAFGLLFPIVITLARVLLGLPYLQQLKGLRADE
jgi:uncharacterized membrane protein YbhN (UPF0104 family)